jgi:hypothetical protein
VDDEADAQASVMAVANAAMVFVKRVMAVSLSNGAGRVGAGRSGIER